MNLVGLLIQAGLAAVISNVGCTPLSIVLVQLCISHVMIKVHHTVYTAL